jgi:signal transduction histidine kinase
MEISRDFDPPDVALTDRRPGEQLEGLLALYQRALGHDLPNQLVSIQGFARMLEGELPPSTPQDVRDLLGRLAGIARKADEQARALAGIGRLLRAADAPASLDLGELVHEAATETRLVFKATPVEYHFSDDWPALTIGRTLLYRSLVELLRNGFQAAAVGRQLTIAVSALRDREGHVALVVSDNGRGVTEPQLRQIEATLAGRPGGTGGTGLVLVRLAVAGWGGSIRFASEPGQSTTVTLIIRSQESAAGTS